MLTSSDISFHVFNLISDFLITLTEIKLLRIYFIFKGRFLQRKEICSFLLSFSFISPSQSPVGPITQFYI